MATVEKEGRTIDEAIENALIELSVREEEVEIEVLVPPSKGFLGIGARLAKVRVTEKVCSGEELPVRLESVVEKKPANINAESVAAAKDFLQSVFSAMNIPVSLEKLRSKDSIVLNLRGENLGVLIGKRGQTLDALQYLTHLVANKSNNDEKRTRIILDVEDYRRRRHETLKKLAYRLAAQVKREGTSQILEPMTSQERKVIHTALQGDRRITTTSEGEEPRRKVVIALSNGNAVAEESVAGERKNSYRRPARHRRQRVGKQENEIIE